MRSSNFAFLTALPLAAAHFRITWPPSRGFNVDQSGTFPCGGFNTPSSQRTSWPMRANAPIQLNLEHTETRIQVVLALGDGDGSYSIELIPTFQEQGPEDFCLGAVNVPSNVNVTEGQRATIQVITNGDPEGGLYQCADVTLTNNALSPADYSQHCRNATGVTSYALPGGRANANGTTSNSGGSPSSPSGTGAPSGTGTATGAAASTSSRAYAAHATLAPWAFGAMGAAGALAAW